MISLFTVYKLDTWLRDLSMNFTLGDCLCGAVKSVKNLDQNKNGYSVYAIRFNARSRFSLPNGDWGKNVVVVEVNKSSSKHILVLGEGPTQGLDDTTITTKVKYSIVLILRNQERKFVSVRITMEARVFLYADGVKLYQFKAKN